jgi:hypothetical protein
MPLALVSEVGLGASDSGTLSGAVGGRPTRSALRQEMLSLRTMISG